MEDRRDGPVSGPRGLAAEVRTKGNEVFWNAAAGRFAVCIDSEGQAHDYGFVSPNLEAVHFDFATPEHARSILDWISGARLVEGDTVRGEEIYRWIFAPLTTDPAQSRLVVLAEPGRRRLGKRHPERRLRSRLFLYDLMARLKVRGPDDAWARLKAILGWFGEVKAAGGYKEYYARRGGSLQGGNVGGNLGITLEFWESAMVPQIMLNGFLGFRPEADGFSLRPDLPCDWPELAIDHLSLHGRTLGLKASAEDITVTGWGGSDLTWRIRLPGRFRTVEFLSPAGS